MTADRLASALATLLGVPSVENLARLSGGASRETWRLEAAGRPFILQRQREGDVRDMSVEARVLRAAHSAGVPVADLVASGSPADGGAAADIGGAFMLLAFVEGVTIARKILRDDDFASARPRLVDDMAAALARLHRIDPADVPGLPSTDQVTQYRASLDSLNEVLVQSHPAFELAFRWLDANRPPATAQRVVHGDFRLGNLMIGPDGLRAVLDWELAHVGDPMEDLGWLCVRAWRFGSKHPVAGVGEYDDLIGAYSRASGTVVDREVVRWWEVLGTLKWGIMCMLQASAHLTGVTRSHELAAIGRRVCENEYDLFLAIGDRFASITGGGTR
ncbi:MAG: phosphotransferase family protein [Ilumatobacteraceae bacterium]